MIRSCLGPVPALLAALYLCIAFLGPAVAAPKAAELVQVELVSEVGAVRPGEPFTVGVKLTAKERWHTYWRNPGDSGLATTIAWTLPAGFVAGEIQWPIPERIPVGPLVNYGFEGETVLLVSITPPRGLPAGQPVLLKAAVNYLVCEKICIPGEAAVSTSVPVASPGSTTGTGPGRPVIEAARARLPQPSPWSSRAVLEGGTLTLALDAPGLKREAIRSAYFFPYDETAIEHAAEQPVSVDGAGLSLKLTRSSLATAPPPADLGGVLVIEEVLDGTTSRQAIAIGREPAVAAGAGSQPPRPTRRSPPCFR
jgi:thiol:disulfide interchange protein DsbD